MSMRAAPHKAIFKPGRAVLSICIAIYPYEEFPCLHDSSRELFLVGTTGRGNRQITSHQGQVPRRSHLPKGRLKANSNTRKRIIAFRMLDCQSPTYERSLVSSWIRE